MKYCADSNKLREQTNKQTNKGETNIKFQEPKLQSDAQNHL